MKITYWFLFIYDISQNYWDHSWAKPLPRGKSETSISFKNNVMDSKRGVHKLSRLLIRNYILLRTVVHKHFKNTEIFLSKPTIMKHSQIEIFIQKVSFQSLAQYHLASPKHTAPPRVRLMPSISRQKWANIPLHMIPIRKPCDPNKWICKFFIELFETILILWYIQKVSLQQNCALFSYFNSFEETLFIQVFRFLGNVIIGFCWVHEIFYFCW